MNQFCLTTFSFNYFKSSAGSFFLVFPSRLSVTFDIQFDLKMKHQKFRSQFGGIFRALSDIRDGGFCKNSERLFAFDCSCRRLRLWVFDKILSSPLNPEKTCGKSSISDVQRGLEFTFVFIIFAYLFTKFDYHISTIYQARQYCALSNLGDLDFNIFA